MIGVTLHLSYPQGILCESTEGIIYATVKARPGYYVFDRFQPTQALSTILIDVFFCESVGFLIKPKSKSHMLWPTGILAYSNSRLSDNHMAINKEKVALVFKGDFYIHNVDNTATLLTIDSLPSHIETLLTIQG